MSSHIPVSAPVEAPAVLAVDDPKLFLVDQGGEREDDRADDDDDEDTIELPRTTERAVPLGSEATD